LSISEDEDEVADEAAASDDAGAELDGTGRPASTAAKWGMAGLLLVYAGLGSYALTSALGAGPAHPEGVTRSTAIALAAPAADGAGGAGGSNSSGTDAAAVAAAKSYLGRAHAARVASAPVAESAAPPVEVLTAVSATAIGPFGASDGDHPQLAQYVVDPQLGTSWITHWYASAHFGELKEGTGLLLDMGRVVTIRQVQLALAGSPGFWGADVEIRIGDTPNLGNAKPVAVADDVGGWVMPKLRSPARGRYVQIWFTKLPLDSWGTYQEHVYGVTFHGSVPASATRPGDSGTPGTDTSSHTGRFGHPGPRGHNRGYLGDGGNGHPRGGQPWAPGHGPAKGGFDFGGHR
jgi:hypothetical protein